MALTTAVDISWIAVILGTIWYQALGAAWYGPVFGSRWMDAMGFDKMDDAPDGDSMTMKYVMTTIGSLVAVIVLGLIVEWAGATSIVDGVLIGVIAGIGFVATNGLQAVAFEDRPWPVYYLGVGYNVVALAGAGVLLVVL